MKLGLDSYTTRNSGLDPVGVLKLACGLGLQGVLFELSPFRSFRDRDLDAVRAAAGEMGMYVELGMGSIFRWHPMAEKGRALLAEAGYEVHLVDPVPLHVAQADAASRARASGRLASARVGDARRLDVPDASADAVLMLGPLYHLPHGYLNAILLPYVLNFYMDGATARLAELARACGLGQDGDAPRSLATNLVGAIQQLNAAIGIPPTIAQIADADIPEIVRRALAEAHGTYPVPKYMSAAECGTIVQNAAGRAMVAPADQRGRAVEVESIKEKV